jgi:hypothetical protein
MVATGRVLSFAIRQASAQEGSFGMRDRKSDSRRTVDNNGNSTCSRLLQTNSLDLVCADRFRGISFAGVQVCVSLRMVAKALLSG